MQLSTGDAARLGAAGAVRPAESWIHQEHFTPPAPSRSARRSRPGDAATAGLLYGLLAGLDARETLEPGGADGRRADQRGALNRA